MEEDSRKSPIQVDALLAFHCEKAIEVKLHDQIDEAMEIQIQV